MPEISVIVPVYQAEQYLERCIKSVLVQTYFDFELILINDGSPDNSLQICNEWAEKDNRIHVIHKENGGASSARNAGLKVAKGNWITFLDSDDWLDKSTLKMLYDIVNEYKVPMGICEMKLMKKYSDTHLTEKYNVNLLSRTDLLNRFFRVNGGSDPHRVWGTIIHRDILDGYNFVEGKMNEDVETCYYLARKCDAAVYTNMPLYNYFKNNEGVTNSGFSKKKLDLLDIWNIVQNEVEKYTPEYSYACNMNYKRAYFTLLTQMSLNGYDHQDPFMIKTKKNLKMEVRKSFWKLMKWKMPLSRKILLIVDCFI